LPVAKPHRTIFAKLLSISVESAIHQQGSLYEMANISLATVGRLEADAASRVTGNPKRRLSGPAGKMAFGRPRDFLQNHFVYLVLSARAGGLSVGVNMNPDKRCNFDCGYCEVNRKTPGRSVELDVDVMAAELVQTLDLVQQGRLRELPPYRNLPDELLQLRHVALSGDGEPTLCPNFAEAVQAVVHVRALGSFPLSKIVLITNATGFDLPEVCYGLKFLTKRDEIWAKLDAGTQAYMDKINRPDVSLERVMANILMMGRQRPIVIQSLFPLYNGAAPPESEIDAYVQRLRELKAGGTQISLVQICSADRPTPHSESGHLPLKSLSGIARIVRESTRLNVEVF